MIHYLRKRLYSNLYIVGTTLALLLTFSTSIQAGSHHHGHHHMPGDVMVHGGWVREAPPSAQVLAAYMVIKNMGKENQSLKEAQSPDFKTIEIHNTIHKNGMATMVKMKDLPVPAGETATLKPGGKHIMLIGPKRLLREGDTVSLTLIFDHDLKKEVKLSVKKGFGNRQQDHHHHHH
ncbi:copper chaperone PCu(A)C [Magnetococcales bacterium HHB-1]